MASKLTVAEIQKHDQGNMAPLEVGGRYFTKELLLETVRKNEEWGLNRGLAPEAVEAVPEGDYAVTAAYVHEWVGGQPAADHARCVVGLPEGNAVVDVPMEFYNALPWLAARVEADPEVVRSREAEAKARQVYEAILGTDPGVIAARGAVGKATAAHERGVSTNRQATGNALGKAERELRRAHEAALATNVELKAAYDTLRAAQEATREAEEAAEGDEDDLPLWGVCLSRTLVQTAYVEVRARTVEEAKERAESADSTRWKKDELRQVANDAEYEVESVELIERGAVPSA